MRKFVVSLLILVVAGAVVFYFGWIQLQLPADTYGVIFTKTGGFESTVAKPGAFTWRWQRLLPTNLTLYTFRLTPQHADLTSSGTLPSGSLYSQYIAGKPDFSYKLAFAVSYLLNPSSLPELMVNDSIAPNSLASWYSDFSQRCNSEAQRFVSDLAKSDSVSSFTPGVLEPALLRDLKQKFPEALFLALTAESIHLPDLSLYQRARQQYFAIVEAEQQGRTQAAVNKTNLDELATQRIDMLRRFGELFNQYPVLLKYLDLDPAKRQNLIPGFGPGQ